MIFTKKVLILSVIAMLALSVMALAGTYTASATPGSVSVGATCANNALIVKSVIGIEQGYVATATSYDASFCGAPCSCTCNDGTSIIYRARAEGNFTSYPSESATATGILLSKLEVQSNMQLISVSVAVTQPSFSENATYYLVYNSNGTTITSNFYETSSQSIQMSLSPISGNSSPYAGEIYVVINGSKTAWGTLVTPGDYFITTTFTISPQNKF